MIFLSTLLRQSIYDNENHRVGVLRDVCVALHETFPVVTALVIHPSLHRSMPVQGQNPREAAKPSFAHASFFLRELFAV